MAETMTTVQLLCQKIDGFDSDLLSPELAGQAKEFVVAAVSHDALLPSVVPVDGIFDGVVVFHWVAGNSCIEVEVGSDGASYLWASFEDGSEVTSEDESNIPSLARDAIDRLTSQVHNKQRGDKR